MSFANMCMSWECGAQGKAEYPFISKNIFVVATRDSQQVNTIASSALTTLGSGIITDMKRIRSKIMPEHTHMWRCFSTRDLPQIKLLFPPPLFF